KMAEEQSVRLNMAATKTAEAFYFLGSAGLSVTDQMKAYVPVATLAKAAAKPTTGINRRLSVFFNLSAWALTELSTPFTSLIALLNI
ncbi:unnamed protein product, partial [marine sediment metagenome]